MNPAWKEPKVLGMMGGAIVIGGLAVWIFISTVFLVMGQRQKRDAVSDFYSLTLTKKSARPKGWKKTERKLIEASQADPSDGGPIILLAAHSWRQKNLSKAERLFKRARSMRQLDPDPWLGSAVVQLKKAEQEPGVRAKYLKKVAEYLETAEANGADFEAKVLRGAVSLLEGKLAEAYKTYNSLDRELTEIGEGFPNRQVLACFYWNKSIAQLLNGDAKCLTSFQQAIVFRPAWEEASDVFARALCFFLVENVAPAELRKRLKTSEQVVNSRQDIMNGDTGKKSNRYGLTPKQLAIVLNAMGLAYCQLKEYPAAAKKFFAARHKSNAVVYHVNRAIALERSATLLKGQERKEALSLSASGFVDAAALAAKTGMGASERYTLLMNASYCSLTGGKYRLAVKPAMEASKLGVDDAEAFRVLGISQMLLNRSKDAVRWFQKAIDAGHSDAGELEIRVQAMGN